ncbi:hypothetical protein JR316_0013507 [Psilocybe cubensis]|uniref:Uncharacterized protein n=2 Tax=Psilocybe cubensis TaxID=181762 RepID=A0A8H7XJF5_PSICU|nr:uncharacterized protein JR316_0013507 [Psilocybe cubensis]KAH9474192.1 hypothetical protein JR316_0013507 [Psilocybe cubensis]
MGQREINGARGATRENLTSGSPGNELKQYNKLTGHSEHYQEYADTVRESLVHYGIQEDLANAIITEQMFLLTTELLFRLQKLEAENKRLDNNLLAYGRISKRSAAESTDDNDGRPSKKPTHNADTAPNMSTPTAGVTTRDPENNDPTYDILTNVVVPGERHPSPKLKRDPSRDHPNPVGYRTEDEDSEDESNLSTAEANRRLAKRQLDFDMYSGRIDNVWGVVLHPQLSPQRLNILRNTLPRHTWFSERSNTVFTGNTAIAAMQWERTHDNAYNPFKNPLYATAPRGVPRNPLEVKGLVRITQDETFEPWVRVEAYILLRVLKNAAAMSNPQVHDRAMQCLEKVSVDEFTPKVDENEWMEIALPHDFDRIRNFANLHKNNRGMGIPMPKREHSLLIDDFAQYALMHARPGSISPLPGIAMRLSLEVDRRSSFGQGLVRVLGPVDKAARHEFTKAFAALASHANRYREAIEAYDAQNPGAPFEAQEGPTYSFVRSSLTIEGAKLFGIVDIIELLVRNRIPVSWIDHAYPFGFNYLNARISRPIPNNHHLAVYDDERLARIDRFGVPPAIPEWDGWRQPSEDDRLRLYVLMSLDEKAKPKCQGFQHYTWIRIGDPAFQRFLKFRDQNIIDDQERIAAARKAPTGSTVALDDNDDEMIDATSHDTEDNVMGSALLMEDDIPTQGIASLSLKKVNSI